MGEMIPGQPPDSEILNNEAVDSDPGQIGQNPHQLGQLLFLDQGIEGDIEAAMLAVGMNHHPFHLGQGEILGLGPGGKLL